MARTDKRKLLVHLLSKWDKRHPVVRQVVRQLTTNQQPTTTCPT